MNSLYLLKQKKKRQVWVITLLALSVAVMSLICLLLGSSSMSMEEGLRALFGQGTGAQLRIMRSIRLPRVLAAVIAGAGLAISGLMMQTTLNNSMASPSTLGVSNGAVFGANLSIIAFGGGMVSSFDAMGNPYAAGGMAFLFAMLSVVLILGLCRLRAFSPNVVVLAGIALGSVWTAATTMLQFYATDVGLSAAVVWSFGDLSRATYQADFIMLAVVAAGLVFFLLMSWQYNALLSGEATAKTMGIHVERLRFLTLLISSLITAVCVSYLGIIGFVGVICPHIIKKILGQDHRICIPASCLAGSLLLLLSDTLSRCLGDGAALPVGAITSLLGAPFFMFIIFSGKENRSC